ncbi:MAG: C-GCAxxG-C-C family protein, partial [Hominenteromicrobium sp.]
MEIRLEDLDTNARAQQAMALHKAGYNCAQAVFLAFSDRCALDEAEAARLAGPLGGGLGGQHEVCGAVSAMGLVLGALYGYANPADKPAKAALYGRVQACSAAYKAVTGSIICRELLGLTESGASLPPGERPKS